jgi:DNA repair protein RecO (recombination protein O)
MEEKLSGIVLGGISFGENDKILKIFTLEKGVVSAKIKGVKKAGAKLKFAAEPFCFVEFIFSVRNDMRTVIGASLIDSFYPVREDIVKYFCAGTVLEFIKKFYKENITSADAFLNTVNTLKDIAYGDGSPKNRLIKFLLDELEDSGFALSFNGCSGCGCEIEEGRVFFDYRSGAFFCLECFDGVGREVNFRTLKALKNADQGIESPSEDQVKALRLLSYYIENRADEKFNSLEELIKILG